MHPNCITFLIFYTAIDNQLHITEKNKQNPQTFSYATNNNLLIIFNVPTINQKLLSYKSWIKNRQHSVSVSVIAFSGVSTGYISRFSIFTDSQNIIIRVRSGIINKFLLCAIQEVIRKFIFVGYYIDEGLPRTKKKLKQSEA